MNFCKKSQILQKFHGQRFFFSFFDFLFLNMQRRRFLLSSLAALVALPAYAAPKKQNKKNKKTTSKTKTPANQNKKKNKAKMANAPKTFNVATPEKSIIDQEIKGATTDHLPPLKAPNPPDSFRTFECAYLFEMPEESGKVEVFCPLPQNIVRYQMPQQLEWMGQVQAKITQNVQGQFLQLSAPPSGFFKSSARGKINILSTAQLAMRQLDVAKRTFAPEIESILRENLKETAMIPTHGKVRTLALQIIGRIQDPLAQSKALYDWLIHHAKFSDNAKINGAKALIDAQFYAGSAFDLSALFVALCRSIGIPARSVYGWRVGKSQIVPNLPLSDSVRSEFYIPGYGWIGIDLHSVLEGKTLSSNANLPKLFFGLWENNFLIFHWGENVLENELVFTTPFALHNQKRLPHFVAAPTFREI